MHAITSLLSVYCIFWPPPKTFGVIDTRFIQVLLEKRHKSGRARLPSSTIVKGQKCWSWWAGQRPQALEVYRQSPPAMTVFVLWRRLSNYLNFDFLQVICPNDHHHRYLRAKKKKKSRKHVARHACDFYLLWPFMAWLWNSLFELMTKLYSRSTLLRPIPAVWVILSS